MIVKTMEYISVFQQSSNILVKRGKINLLESRSLNQQRANVDAPTSQNPKVLYNNKLISLQANMKFKMEN